MKMIRNIASILLLFFTAFTALADDPTFRMSAPTIVKMGEQFSLTLSLNAQGEELRLPSLDNFNILMGPSTSSSRSFSMVNGKMSQSVEYAYTYILVAEKEGTYTISPATIKSNRKVIQSNSINIQVIQGQQPAAQQSQGSGSSSQASQSAAGSRENLFIRYETDKRNVYRGEMIAVTLKLYSRVNLSIADQTLPSFEGFWAQDIEIPNAESTRTREAVDGIIYNVYTLQKKVIIPQQSGKLTIEPAEMVFNIQQRVAAQSIFDDFFGSYQNVPTKVSTDRITINVKDLPPAPAGFKGAVGEFTINSSIDRNQINANEAITLKVIVSGTGNLRHISPIDFNFPPDFEVYDPKTTYNHRATLAGISGSTAFEHLIIPRFAGTYNIPSKPFVFFNPKTQSYQTLNTNAFDIKVEKGTDDATGAAMVSGISKENIRFLGQDVRFIKKDNPRLKPHLVFFFGSGTFYLLYLVAFVLFAAMLVWQRKTARENANMALMRNKKASKMARKHLKAASLCVKHNNRDQFFEALLKAFWGYLSDKLTIPMAELNRDSAKTTLEQYMVPTDTIEEFIKVVDTCEMARFAPAAITESISDIYKKGEKLIDSFERQIKKKK